MNEQQKLNARIKCICGAEHLVDPEHGVVQCDCGAFVYIGAKDERIFPEVIIDTDTYAHQAYLNNEPVFLGWE